MKDRLFMLRPGFFDGDEGPFYCGDSVAVEGLLSFFPGLRDAVDVEYVEAARPRAALVALIGEANQSVPVIVLAPDSALRDESVGVTQIGDVRFINDPGEIRRYLSSQFGFAKAA